MSSWVALNIEPAEAVEEEVDDTKEIQIEEALKLYQNALKLHSQGRDFFTQAAEAYDALLSSEIFKYPESISDYKRAALQNSELQLSETPVDTGGTDVVEPLGDYDINDSISSTLLQTIYLSYKNHGQFVLDALRAVIEDAAKAAGTAHDLSAEIAERASTALTSFVEALERDDTDLNLWRQSARLCGALKSYRLARYCLESVLADDENRLEVRTEQLGLEEAFAEERLRETLLSLYDRISVSQVPIKKPKKALLKFLKRQSDPYPYLPALPNNLQDEASSRSSLALRTARHELKLLSPTWAALGRAVLQVLVEEEQGAAGVGPGTAISVSIPVISPKSKPTVATDTRSQDQSLRSQNEEPQSDQRQIVRMPGDDNDNMEVQPLIKPETLDSVEHIDDHSSIDQRAEKQLMESLEIQTSQSPDVANQHEAPNVDEPDHKSSTIGARKRSSASAITEDQTESIRSKSRRTRLRESHAEAYLQTDEVTFDHNKYYEDRLGPFKQADDWMFGTVGSMLSKFRIEELGSVDELRKQVCPTIDEKDLPVSAFNGKAEYVLPRDLKDILKSWDEGKSQATLQSDSVSALQDIQGMGKSGLAIFLEHSRKSARKLGMRQVLSGVEELLGLVKTINEGWFNVHEVAFTWLSHLLMPDYGRASAEDSVSCTSNLPIMRSSYTLFQWPDTLKETVVQILIREDVNIYKGMCEHVETLERQILCCSPDYPFEYTTRHFSHLEMMQAIFELHLDIYSSINNPNSEVDQVTRLQQRDRLARWSLLARTSLTHFMDNSSPGSHPNNIVLRHIWASTFHSNMITDAEREHVLLCLQELKQLLSRLKDPVINIVNNAIMPEISIEAVDQEISKLESMDFFMRIFNTESEDPVGLIETIEPILEPSSVQFVEESTSEEQGHARPTSQLHEMGSFLDRGDATLRLFLWKRLQDAYKKIDYSPKVVSCYLRSIETIVKELWNPAHLEEPGEHRQITLLRWLKSLDGILSKTITTVFQEPEKAYECFDMGHVKSSISAVTLLLKLLHGFVLYEDSVRVGQIPRSDVRGALAKSLESFKDKLREMYVRCWILQYTLLREAIAQNPELFDTPLEDRILFLRSVHNALGIRKLCKRSHKQFLKLLKLEIFSVDVIADYEFDICQMLYDIHGIKLSPVDGYLQDHGCPPEKLDRSTAILMIDFVMKQARKMNIKDLSKSEFKYTIEKMQGAIGTTKSSPPLSYNRRILTSYLKSPLNPTEIFRAVRGVEDLPLLPVPTESAVIAKNGWYFLLGHAALTKFRSQKRLNPVPTTDLDEAITWFRQDLEHNTQRWESWYRLAQTYDSKLEEDITWSADKINNNRMELVTWQRYAIHCYAMAVAAAARSADPTPDTRALLSDLYTDFGIRLYSSSREPLSMAAFSLTDFTRHYNSEDNQQMYQALPFKEMRLYSAWNLASYLFKRAMVDKPKNWMTHYMLSKCLWKMFSCDGSVRGTSKRVTLDELLDSLLDAIDALPQKKDSRSDPIFEPHYKLVSIVHKLVQRGILTPADGSKTLVATPWVRKVPPPEEGAPWKPYIMAVIRNLKHADKSNWHHRMAIRAANIIYNNDKDATAAAAAKGELTQQIFTKTMTIQVWRPEYERPGRHFVYTTRYVYFFVALLEQLDDRASLDQLLRRVRKKQGDFINHAKLWEDLCLTYARVIRKAGRINEGHDESVFKPIGWEEFVANTARLEVLSQLAPESTQLLELLRDAVELKKLNNNLMKVSLLEDLIADIYSRLYEVNMPHVLEQANEENKEKMKVDHLLMASDGAADTPTPPTSAPASEAPAPRGRTKGIARRDIQKRAEAIVQRKVAPRAPVAKVATAMEAETSHATGGVTSAPQQTKGIATSAAAADELGLGQQSDVPNSLHESADDESELSEIDDEKLSKLERERKLLFPNLQDRGSLDPELEMSAQASADGDGANEGAGEMEEDADLGEEGETMVEEGEEGADGDEAELDVEGEGEGEEEEDIEAEEEGVGEGDGEPEGEADGNEAVEMDVDDAGEEHEQLAPPETEQESDHVSDSEAMDA
ncbi:histone transcription regulator 3 [Aspergillus leporis]|jgi:tetratricopeptide (TPR) repeat protein|uniref:Histone transcription regulator 3 homolog n=1 Tax=Aspergillus leporis TaxID=41062 RepID=A0A5N5XHD1_9EURO|nr:histone transcription regulator 3 [Aspergillus leporis]